MESSDRAKWIPVTVLVGIIYLVTGVVFAALAAGASSDEAVHWWRVAAWLISGLAFLGHIGYELYAGRSTRTSAFHAALAAAFGAFGLAVSALIHRHSASSHTNYFAFLVWPVVVSIPAFLVAWVLATLVSRALRNG